MNAASPFAHDRAPTEYILIMPKYGVLPVLQVLRTDYSVLRTALVVHMYLRTKEYLYFCVGLPFCQTVDVRSTSTCILHIAAINHPHLVPESARGAAKHWLFLIVKLDMSKTQSGIFCKWPSAAELKVFCVVPTLKNYGVHG